MLHFKQPSFRRLTIVWFFLAGLAVASMFGARVDLQDNYALGPLMTGIIFVIGLVKAEVILMEFLNLRYSTSGWRNGFRFALILLSLTLYGLYLFANL